MDEDKQPIFPPEIEEIIFSFAAYDDVKTSANLIFVARRVYEWLKPHLYDVAILRGVNSQRQRPRFSSHLLRSQGKYVRYILFWDAGGDPYLNEPAICLEWCPNVVNIALWRGSTKYDKALVDALLNLPLTQISFDITWFNLQLGRHSITKPISFPFVTHLHLIGINITLPADKIKEFFPAVTHIALNRDMKLSAETIVYALKTQLKVLVWFYSEFSRLPNTNDLPNDPRIVVMRHNGDFVGDWNEIVEDSSRSFWRMAEAEIKGRLETTTAST